ncbi:MAG: hypothetical protein WA783_07410 [Phormidesmis sp.]
MSSIRRSVATNQSNFACSCKDKNSILSIDADKHIAIEKGEPYYSEENMGRGAEPCRPKIMSDQLEKIMERFYKQIKLATVATMLVVFMTFIGVIDSAAAAPHPQKMAQEITAANLPKTQPLVAYNIDYKMDLARAERTVEHYGEKIRNIVEQALRNNENNPQSKATAKNSYQRKSAFNDILPERRSSAFSKDELSNLRKTEHPRDRLK